KASRLFNCDIQFFYNKKVPFRDYCLFIVHTSITFPARLVNRWADYLCPRLVLAKKAPASDA
ncbi:MAG TPA: hypothetical protein DIT25_01995, partial [Candidatus Moranbacteria bacterium]|nr:hypothetical protein [Candidatus Moranbacteria bacterium]